MLTSLNVGHRCVVFKSSLYTIGTRQPGATDLVSLLSVLCCFQFGRKHAVSSMLYLGMMIPSTVSEWYHHVQCSLSSLLFLPELTDSTLPTQVKNVPFI